MPFSDTSTAPLFYADVIGINTATQTRGTTALAVELANMLASTDTMVASMKADNSGTPQYLIATRNSAFQQLSQSDVTYQDIYTMVKQAKPILFTLNEKARDWVKTMKSTLTGMIRENYPCGCDYEAGPILNQTDAESRCPGTCTSYGGWNGQWRTIDPGKMSVCGCNACQ